MQRRESVHCTAPVDGWSRVHGPSISISKAMAVAIDQYAAKAFGNREYFLGTKTANHWWAPERRPTLGRLQPKKNQPTTASSGRIATAANSKGAGSFPVLSGDSRSWEHKAAVGFSFLIRASFRSGSSCRKGSLPLIVRDCQEVSKMPACPSGGLFVSCVCQSVFQPCRGSLSPSLPP